MILEFISHCSSQFPIDIIDEYQDTWSTKGHRYENKSTFHKMNVSIVPYTLSPVMNKSYRSLMSTFLIH
jgi:hypothetical protein